MLSDDSEPTTELTIVDLIRYGLEHADRNLPCKVQPTISKAILCNNDIFLLFMQILCVLASAMMLIKSNKMGGLGWIMGKTGIFKVRFEAG